MDDVRIVEPDDAQREWASDLAAEHFGSRQVVSRGALHDLAELPALVALADGAPIGVAFYRLEPAACELVAIIVTQQRRGVGRALVAEVEALARAGGAGRLWLITTNDNRAAQAFYSALGFALRATHTGAVRDARRLKPEIPLLGEGGVPIEDELEYERRLRSACEIGRVCPDDLPAIAKLHAHFWGEASDIAEMARTLDRLEDDEEHLLLAARIGGTCVGTATGVVCHGLYGGFDSYLVIEDVVVDPDHRRQGVASSLLAELERVARERDCKQMILLTESCRHDAVALYHSADFEGRWVGFKKKL
jgi:ribosomal protein S18 acetylase RimI-like enzyme